MMGRLLHRAVLTPTQLDGMYRLMASHFEGIEQPQFQHDLQEKNQVILLEDESGRLRGFSTLLFYQRVFEGERLNVVYSGDTIVDPEAWGSSVLARTWIDSVYHLHREHGGGRLYWLLITSGFRTYRFLPVFWREFFPRHDAHTPPRLHRLMLSLATERFGGQYDESCGIVRFAAPQVLREELRGIATGRLSDRHVAFFAERNPGFVHGDELVCLADLSPDNLTAAGRRMLRVNAGERSAAVVEVSTG